MRSAVVIVDMVKDSLELGHYPKVAQRGQAIVPAVNRLIAGARRRDWPVIFTTDSFLENDFIFGGRMQPHSIRGTQGAEVSGLLDRQPQDHWLPKRRLSGFFKTDLDQTLRLWGVERVLVCGLMTPYCVLTTALDAVAHDFRAVLVADASNAIDDATHEGCLAIYRKSPLDPLLTVQTVDQLLA